MNANVRKARIQEIPVLNEIAWQSKRYWGYSEELMRLWKDDLTLDREEFINQSIYKIEFRDKIIGFSSIMNNPKYYELTHLWILPEFIGRGFGKMLLAETLRREIKKKKDILVEADPNAEQFYYSQGFVTIGRRESHPKGRFLPVMKLMPNTD